LGSYYKDASKRRRSPTARNIGYTDEMAEKYPWVRQATQAANLGKAKASASPSPKTEHAASPVAGNPSSG
jgi:hypothetical protein